MLEIRADRLLDGVADQSNADAVVLVDNGAIVAVDTRADTRWDTEVVDLGDVTLLSGLIDSHSHLAPQRSAYGDPVTNTWALARSYVTTARNAAFADN